MTDFQSLYERYAPAIRRFALFLSGDASIADDITSETFVRAWTSTDAIREQTVKAYLFTIARNVYRDILRRERRLEPLRDSIPDARVDLASRVEHSAELATVLAAMRELNEIDRTALSMRASEDMSYEEIAGALELSVASVKTRVHRARVKLIRACRPANKIEGATR